MIMKSIVAIGIGLLSLMLVTAAQAQVKVQLSQERSIYLQYEALELAVTITNVTDSPISLNAGNNGKSWLSFLVFTQDGSTVDSIKPVDIGQVTLKPGETQRFVVNILPYYGIRSTGGYSVQAVINIPGLTPIMTGKLYFTEGKGETISTQEIYNMGVKRVYSLIRFLDVNDCNLYLRVEEPDLNLVYSTVRLGKVVNFTEPEKQFDAKGNLHIVQVVGTNIYRYTEADPQGNILKQETRSGVAGQYVPTLAQEKDGSIVFAGGQGKVDKVKRAKLSDSQGVFMSTEGK
jgi:hypothetical protein